MKVWLTIHDGVTLNNYVCFIILVVYDGCPRSRSNGIWWPRTVFGEKANESCPKGSQGKVSRICDSELGGWQDPDMFNCTSDKLVDLREQVCKHLPNHICNVDISDF